MARDEHDREDLLREATALVERIELAPGGAEDGEHIVIGFRADGAAGIYFGGDTAYHFNARGELRRAHAKGLLFNSERGQLVSLERIRQASEVQLVRRPLTREQQAEFLAAMGERLRWIAAQVREDALATIGQVPADADVPRRVLRWLEDHRSVSVAKSPHAR